MNNEDRDILKSIQESMNSIVLNQNEHFEVIKNMMNSGINKENENTKKSTIIKNDIELENKNW